jgi:hypothetical protein
MKSPKPVKMFIGGEKMFEKIRKMDGRIVKFDTERITNAIAKAGEATGEFDREVAKELTLRVLNLAQQIIKDRIPTVEVLKRYIFDRSVWAEHFATSLPCLALLGHLTADKRLRYASPKLPSATPFIRKTLCLIPSPRQFKNIYKYVQIFLYGDRK